MDYILLHFGFGDLWSRWMKECISITSFSVVVNGSLTQVFKSIQRDLWKADPLSPFLFTRTAKALGVVLLKAKDLGLIRGL